MILRFVNGFIFFGVLAFVGCKPVDSNGLEINGSGKLKSEVRSMDLDEIKTIEIDGDFNVSFTTKRSGSTILVIAEDNLLPYIETKQSNGTLSISNKAGYSLIPKKDINIDIKALSLSGINIQGNGSLLVDTLQGIEPHIDINGSGILDIKGFKCTKVYATINGTGKCSYYGKVSTLDLTINGAGFTDVFASTLTIFAAINGAGVVRYKGDPYVKPNISGTGSVTKF